MRKVRQAGVQRAGALGLGSGAVPQLLPLFAAAGGTLSNEVGQSTSPGQKFR